MKKRGYSGQVRKPYLAQRLNCFRTNKHGRSIRPTHFVLCSSCSYSALFGSIFLHLAVESSSPDLRRAVNASLTQLASQEPEALVRSASGAISALLTKVKQAGEEQAIAAKSGRLVAFILACASFGDSGEAEFRQRTLVDLLVLAHHPLLCT